MLLLKNTNWRTVEQDFYCYLPSHHREKRRKITKKIVNTKKKADFYSHFTKNSSNCYRIATEHITFKCGFSFSPSQKPHRQSILLSLGMERLPLRQTKSQNVMNPRYNILPELFSPRRLFFPLNACQGTHF